VFEFKELIMCIKGFVSIKFCGSGKRFSPENATFAPEQNTKNDDDKQKIFAAGVHNNISKQNVENLNKLSKFNNNYFLKLFINYSNYEKN
jgi:hypothetical protein